ncbi:hypothetical protein BS333_21305 (plasmid) [Vibrio azureus]|uniref:MPN domain-containing protein n=1 Tax=Vibrio azureus NBRC 104587 TaxID=1219077 RepID=U3ASG1_9VIBR|nr:DNA repair protein RadC [Vibrio azureus]AUI88920.1 hypothetical protein BS333_21305 [Vibrio azureus]GAD76187.1 hypothetical protein VAZ01S_039_00120 [Vibrio azureus NBRC 104587]
MNYKNSYGNGKLLKLEVNDFSEHYYKLTQPVTPQELLEIAHAMAADSFAKGEALSSPEHTKHILSGLLQGIEREVFGVLFLDNQHRIIKFETLFYGTIDAASVYPREVVKHTLMWNAAAVIFCHNHPSGIAEPSQADKRITRKLQDALSMIDVRVLDHFIVGETVISFAERGWV